MDEDQAMYVMTQDMTSKLLKMGLDHGLVRWEDYPEVGEDDWDKIVDTLHEVADDMIPTKHDFNRAYGLLADRTEVET